MSEESRKHNSHAAESWRELAGDVRQWADGHRLAITATVALVVLNLVVWLVVAMAGFAFPLRLDTSMAEFDFGKLFCTLFLARGVIQLILDAALWLVMLSIAEPWLGRARTVGTALACALGGVIVGLTLCAAAGWLFQDSQFVSRMQFALSPLVLPVGALMAASAFCSHLLRRRIRLIGYVAILVALLYSGNPGDYCILAAALIGHAAGRVMAGPPAHAETGWHWLRSTSFEARRMFAAIAVVLALGPIIAITSHNHAGPLSTVGLLMSPVSVDDGTLARCLAGATHSGCFLQFDLLRASMPGAVLRSLLPTAVTLVLAWGLYRASVRGHLRRGHQPVHCGSSHRLLPDRAAELCAGRHDLTAAARRDHRLRGERLAAAVLCRRLDCGVEAFPDSRRLAATDRRRRRHRAGSAGVRRRVPDVRHRPAG